MAVVEARPSSHSGEDCKKLIQTHRINRNHTGILGNVPTRNEMIHPGCNCGQRCHGGGVLISVCEAVVRLFHGGGRRLRRTTDAVGKSVVKHLTLAAA